MEDPHRELQASELLIRQLSRTTGAGRVPAPADRKMRAGFTEAFP
jgi:hypothetical protein